MRTSRSERILHASFLKNLDASKLNGPKQFVFNMMDDIDDYEKAVDLLHSDINRALGVLVTLSANRKKESLPLSDIFGFGIRSRMAGLCMSRKKLSNDSGISEKIVGRICDGRHNPCMDTMEKIAEALGCTAIDIIEYGEVAARDDYTHETK